MEGFATALQPQYLIFGFIGVLVGTAVGVLPGIGPAMTVALLLPLTYSLDPTAALITFAGIYYGGMYGGSTTSILLNTPGESASIVTALEGNKMAKLGRGAAALATAAIGSFVAGTIATVGLTLFAPLIASWAVLLSPADYVALMVVAFITVGALLGSSVWRGLTSLGIGLFLGLVGTEILSGQQRYTFGLLPLADGIDVVLVAVGLIIRAKVPESPVFEDVKEQGQIVKNPIIEVIKTDWRNIVRGIGLRIAETAGYAVSITYMISYLNTTGLANKSETLVGLVVASGIGIFATMAWGRLTDRVGRKPVYVWSCLFALLYGIPMFLMVNTGLFPLIIATMVISYAICQNSLAGAQGSWFPELFNANTRSSGASLAYQISAMVSGFTPFVTTLLFIWLGWVGPALLFSFYAAIGLWAALVTRETWGKRERQLADEATIADVAHRATSAEGSGAARHSNAARRADASEATDATRVTPTRHEGVS